MKCNKNCNCPLTNLPCSQVKLYKVNEIIENNFKTLNLCEKCAQNYLNTETTQEEILNYRKKKEKENKQNQPGTILKAFLDMLNKPEEEIQPSSAVERSDKQALKTLETKLKKAIKNEEYEQADTLKKTLENAKTLNYEYEELKNKIIEAVSKEEFKSAAQLKKQLLAVEERYKKLIKEI